MFGLLDYLDWWDRRHGRLHSPRAERMAEKSPSTPIANSVQTKKKCCELKNQGLPIANSNEQLEVMIPYFTDPASSRVAVQSHNAHEPKPFCSALTMLQIQANGDVTVCSARKAIGNVRSGPIRTIWNDRPHWWEDGCCLEDRIQPA